MELMSENLRTSNRFCDNNLICMRVWNHTEERPIAIKARSHWGVALEAVIETNSEAANPRMAAEASPIRMVRVVKFKRGASAAIANANKDENR